MEQIKTPFYDPLPIYSRSNAEYNLRIDTIEEDIEDIVTAVDYYKNDDVKQDDIDSIFKKIKRFLCGCCCRPEKVKMY